jgi:hypothetical protein
MADFILEQLKRLLDENPNADADVETLDARLADSCRGDRLARGLLTGAAEEGIPATLRRRGAGEIVP